MVPRTRTSGGGGKGGSHPDGWRLTQSRSVAAGALAASVLFSSALAATIQVPFDFSRGPIGLDVTVKGTPLHAILDTGVDPSVIDIGRARELGLKVDRGAGGEASGVGDAASAKVYPATIEALAIGALAFGPFAALAADMSAMSADMGASWTRSSATAS